MNNSIDEANPSWERLKLAWKTDTGTGSQALRTLDVRAACERETRRLLRSVLLDWASTLFGFGLFVTLATKAESIGGRIAFGLVGLVPLLHAFWAGHLRRSLWQASSDTPKAYWTLRAKRARFAITLFRTGPLLFIAGLLVGITLRLGLPEEDQLMLQPMIGGWIPPLIAALLVPIAPFALWRLRHHQKVLRECEGVLAELEGEPEESQNSPMPARPSPPHHGRR
jgi:hypothetical protein